MCAEWLPPWLSREGREDDWPFLSPSSLPVLQTGITYTGHYVCLFSDLITFPDLHDLSKMIDWCCKDTGQHFWHQCMPPVRSHGLVKAKISQETLTSFSSTAGRSFPSVSELRSLGDLCGEQRDKGGIEFLTAICISCYQTISPTQQQAHIALVQPFTAHVGVETLLTALAIPCKSQLEVSCCLRDAIPARPGHVSKSLPCSLSVLPALYAAFSVWSSV